jgi:hypothetical protein
MDAVVVTWHWLQPKRLRAALAPQGTASRRNTPQRPEPNLPWMVAPRREAAMKFVRSMLLWLVGIPLPIVLLIALFVHPA